MSGRGHEGLAALARLGAEGGPSAQDALALFRQLRRGPEEGRAIDAILSAAATRRIDEEILVAAASALVDRGEAARALRSLEGATSASARVLRADLLADQGDLAGALASIERVLLSDYDAPGARERWARWRRALGLGDAPRAAKATDATVVVAGTESPFRLVREVARGGAGVVYEAEDPELLRRVALKVYHHPERDRAQLSHEARVAASLSGRGIVRVFDLDPLRGWIALEWAPLGSLRDRLRDRDASVLLPIERWAIPLAKALARVHAAGWVHHDVKPANVLFAAPDRPMLSDFGTARRVGEPSPPGSLGYVSPERMQGRPSDPRDDIFGFGRILEDVLEALAAVAPMDGWALDGWADVGTLLTGPDMQRPLNGRALFALLQAHGRS